MASSDTFQPPASAAYNTTNNPADQNRAEARHGASGDASNRADLVAAREQGDIPVPSTHEGGGTTANSLAEGGSGQDAPWVPRGATDTEGEKLATYGEGEVASAQYNKTGFGEQADLSSDMDRKKAEQAQAREAIKSGRQEGTIQGGGPVEDSGT